MKRLLKTDLPLLLLSFAITIPVCIYAEIDRKEPVIVIEAVAEPLSVERRKAKVEIIEEVVMEAEQEPESESLGEFKLTAYCSCEKCCGEWAKNRPVDSEGNQIVIGAIGEVLESGKSIAVDPEVIPYGSTVNINGQAYKAQDCGGAIKGNHIDVYFSDHSEAIAFGVQHAEIFLEKKGDEGNG